MISKRKGLLKSKKPKRKVLAANSQAQIDKPPYAVPTMEDIRNLPWNGFNAISTFSGCGGSSTGYRMAGFKVLWASEFIDAARECYEANKAPYTITDGRDIRKVKPEDILSAIGLQKGELDLLDGSPPCASFSTSGKRAELWGQVKKYSDKMQRTDDLFFEFTRILEGVQPKVFVAENVSGLVKGVAKGYFKEILQACKSCGYNVQSRLLDAQWLGVPQQRQRIIFIGVRNDLDMPPAFPDPLQYRYTVRDIMPYVTEVRKGGAPDRWAGPDEPSGTVCAGDATTSATAYLSAGGWIKTDPKTPNITGKVLEEWKTMRPGANSTKYLNLKRAPIDGPTQTITATGGHSSAASVSHPLEPRKFHIYELKKICGFPEDFILTGNYKQQWERLGRAVPPVMMSKIAAAVRDHILRPLNG